MRTPWLAVIAVFFAAAGFMPIPAIGASVVVQPSFSVTAAGPVQAGSPEVFTITRLAGNKGYYVLFATKDGTAKAGTDYTAISKLLYFRAGANTQTVSVPTSVNQAALGQTLSFTGAIAAFNVASATASIVEPPPPTQTCPDGSVILATATCPPPPTQTCPDGSIIAASATCPAPTPIIGTKCKASVDPAWSSGGPVRLADWICTATQNCSSLWRNARTDAANIVLPSLVAGRQYYVNPLTHGLLPDGFSGNAVNATPTDGNGTLGFNHGEIGDWQFDPLCFE